MDAKFKKLLKEYDMPVSPMEQRLRDRFNREVTYQVIAAAQELPSVLVGPGLVEDFETMAMEIIAKVKSQTPRGNASTFYITEKPCVRGKLFKNGIKIILYVRGQWQ